MTDRFIPRPPEYRLESEATAHYGAGNVAASPYFPAIDFFNLESNDHLTILPHFMTYQQTRPYSCASAIALMTLWRFGVTHWKELDIADRMASYHGLPPETRRPVPVSDLQRFFLELGWNVRTNIEHTRPVPDEAKERPWIRLQYAPFTTERSFSRFCRWCLRHGLPILVENMDWGGHWRLIVGYDTMGTATTADDVLILADPHDTGDHNQDGFVVEHVEKFFATWFDVFVMPSHEQVQPWLVVWP